MMMIIMRINGSFVDYSNVKSLHQALVAVDDDDEDDKHVGCLSIEFLHCARVPPSG